MIETADIELRPASGADLAPIVELLDAAGLPSEDLSETKVATFLLALDGSIPRGVVGLEIFDEDALLRSLAVTSKLQRMGLGSRLLRAVEAEAARRGVKALYLLTTTAATFFAKAGYSPCNRNDVPPPIAATEEFSDICPDAATCLSRVL